MLIRSKLFFFSNMLGIFLTLLSFTPKASAQSKIFEVFGASSSDSFGETIACEQKNVFVAAPRTPQFSSSGVGEVRVFDADTQQHLYTIPYPFSSSGNELFGASLLVTQDSDGDSIKEIVVGTPGDVGNFGIPSVIGFNIGSTGNPLFSVNGQTGDHFGASLSLIDFPPKDGFLDIVIGAPGRFSTQTATGAVEIRDPRFFTAPLLTISATENHQNFGHAISRMGDLDANGSDELIIGAPATDNEDGSLLIYSLQPSPQPPILLRTLFGLAASDQQFGSSVIGIPDINQDGKDDLLVGAPGTESTSGSALLFSGVDIASTKPAITPLCTIIDPIVGTNFGHAVAFLDDDNADGKIEIVIAAPNANTNRGELRFYQYSPEKGCEEIGKIAGDSQGDRLGMQMGADFCSLSKKHMLTAGTQSKNGAANSVGSGILFSPLPTVTPTPTVTSTPTPTLTPTATPTPTPNNPTKTQLTFRISETGEFKIVHTYNQEPGANCSYVLYSRIQIGGRLLAVEKLSSGTSSDQALDKSRTIRILNFPSAEKISGQIPIVHMLVRTTCDTTTFDSNVFARFMNCGLPDISVSLSAWLNTLRNALKTAEVQTSIRTDRSLKLVRLKKRRSRRK